MLRLFGCFQPTTQRKDTRQVQPFSTSISVETNTEPFETPVLTQRTFNQPIFGESPGWIYLIREREFLKTGEEIYKIGKTINIKNRMPSYPKGSCLYLCFFCTTNIHKVEKQLIIEFDEMFEKQTDIGNEYYEGDVSLMMNHMLQIPFSQTYF
jgi:hypothetical protein